MHARNKHIDGYDFDKLIASNPKLKKHVCVNKYDKRSIDFSDANAVKELNRALLFHFYDIEYWDIPKNYLCPPIPGRADYIHAAADMLKRCNKGFIPKGNKINILDIGTGSNLVYPIIGSKEYGWSFVGTDIDNKAIESADNIISKNECLNNTISSRLQKDDQHIFEGIIEKDDKFDMCICNPPFHSSEEQANKGNLRKNRNLSKDKNAKKQLNFGGQGNELWCEGGELGFLERMVKESKQFPKSVYWFSSLVSKEKNLHVIYRFLKKYKAIKVKTIEMEQGQKNSRFVAWTFLSKEQETEWIKNWKK